MSDHNFNTPPELLAKVRLLTPKRVIGLDPCSNELSGVMATTEWCGRGPANDDGLLQSWRGHGLVFMNPPHSMSPHNIEPWMSKAFDFEESIYNTDTDDQFVGLIPAKTDTAWFHDYVTAFDVRVFLRGRPRFWLNGAPMPGPGKFASMLIYAGWQQKKFRDIFGEMGWVV